MVPRKSDPPDLAIDLDQIRVVDLIKIDYVGVLICYSQLEYPVRPFKIKEYSLLRILFIPVNDRIVYHFPQGNLDFKHIIIGNIKNVLQKGKDKNGEFSKF